MREFDLRDTPNNPLVCVYFDDTPDDYGGRTREIARYAPNTAAYDTMPVRPVRHYGFEFDSLTEAAAFYENLYEDTLAGRKTGYPWDAWVLGVMKQHREARAMPESGRQPMPNPNPGTEHYGYSDYPLMGTRSSFSRHQSPGDFVHALHHGNAEAKSVMANMAIEINAVAGTLTSLPELRVSHEGQVVDISRMLEGDPECMYAMHDGEETTTSQHGKVLELAVGVTANGFISQDTLLRRGAAMLCLVDALEQAGYAVALTIYEVCNDRHGRETFHLSVRVKHAHQPADIDLLSTALADGDILRRLCFVAQETGWPIFGQEISGNTGWLAYGYSTLEKETSGWMAAEANRRKIPSTRPRLGHIANLDGFIVGPVVPYSDIRITSADQWGSMVSGLPMDAAVHTDDKLTRQYAKWLLDNLAAFGVDAAQREPKGAVV
jgi:hypothetical protein